MMRRSAEPPRLLIEADYWRCPVQVITGLTWFAVGLALGGLLF